MSFFGLSQVKLLSSIWVWDFATVIFLEFPEFNFKLSLSLVLLYVSFKINKISIDEDKSIIISYNMSKWRKNNVEVIRRNSDIFDSSWFLSNSNSNSNQHKVLPICKLESNSNSFRPYNNHFTKNLCFPSHFIYILFNTWIPTN